MRRGTLSLPPSHLPSFPPFARPSGWRAKRGWEEEGKEGREGKEHARPRATIY